ncbi:unnamed protein product [Rotaria sp. Silwood2]|nr:unnamed protein product [Rotaria sp. Silwood2]
MSIDDDDDDEHTGNRKKLLIKSFTDWRRCFRRKESNNKYIKLDDDTKHTDRDEAVSILRLNNNTGAKSNGFNIFSNVSSHKLHYNSDVSLLSTLGTSMPSFKEKVMNIVCWLLITGGVEFLAGSIENFVWIICVKRQMFRMSVFIGPDLQSLSEAQGAAAAVFRLIEESNDASINETDVWKQDTEANYDINGDIEFQNVNFMYPSRKDVPVLRNLSLIARAGQTTALVGSNGCGKSTCISLFLRYYEPSSGQITINDRPITDYNVKQLRQQIGVVSQEPTLFAMSIYENIRFGKVNATRAEIEQAAREANAHHFIMQLPNKYETLVGEHGVQLSGGEKQRIALARALVKQPTFLLLDETTSALDNVNEKIVQEAIDRACRGRTTIVIAHRLTTIRNSHQIYVLDNGGVIEQGTHETLMYTAFGITGSKLTQRIRSKTFACLLRQEVAYFDQPENSSGAICARLSSDALAVQEMAGIRLGAICEALALSWRIAASTSAAESFFDLFDRKPAIDNTSNEGQELVDFRGEIKFDAVKFIYPTRPTSIILNKFQLNIKPSQRVALVGASGCGKSTIIQLLERFYDVTSGQLLLDDVDIRQLNIHWVRSQFGLVSQEPILFDLTIAENIAYGLENVPIEDIINAASRANIHEFIDQLPQSYETKVGFKGSFLSGGEKQRIAIARILLRRPKVLLLDEATSAMDSYNEQIVQEALEQAQTEDPNRTSLIIAHRLSTIRSCDLICVLDKGHIVESGTHIELIQQRGVYYRMLTQKNNLQ